MLKTLTRLGIRFIQSRMGMRMPLICSFLITGDCNLSCKGCSYKLIFESGEPEINTKHAISLIRDLGNIGLPAIIFAGGEPLLRKDLFILAKEAGDCGIYNSLFTNGTLIGSAEAKDIERNFRTCFISLDGDEMSNDEIRSPGSYRKTVAGIETMLRERNKTRVIVACVVNRFNVSNLSDFAEDMKIIGVDGVKFQANFIPELQPAGEDAVAGIDELLSIKSKYPHFIKGAESFYDGMKLYFLGKAGHGCYAESLSHIVISPSGKFFLCCYRQSVLESVINPSDLYEVSHKDCHELLSGCEGCYRYDESILGPLFNGPIYKINLLDVLKNIREYF